MLLVFLPMSMLCAGAKAEERSMEEVMRLAHQHFMQEGVETRGSQQLDVIPSSSLITLPEKQETFYLCNSAGNGFVLISADEQVPAVLGYSSADFHSSEDLPDGLLSVLQGYTQLKGNCDVTRSSQFAKTEVAPMLKTQWDQSDPYNRNCPAHSVAGCVATAAAQIMRYFEYPKKYGTGTIDYVTDTQKMHIYISLPDYSFAWDLMLDTYQKGSYSNAQAAAVSKLIYAIAAASKMDFGRNDSGASLISCAQGLYQYFGYDKDMYMLYGECVPTDQWHDLLVKELNQSRPVLFSGISNVNGVGHAFVLDGYQVRQDEIYYHVNWGWNGSGDGHYLINQLTPKEEGVDLGMGSFNSEQLMLLNFQPDDDIDNQVLAAVNQFSMSKTEFEPNEILTFDLRFDLMLCMRLKDFSGSVVFQVVNEQGEVVKEIEKENFQLSASDLTHGTWRTFKLPALPAGEYSLRASLKERSRTIEMLSKEPWPVFTVGNSQSAITELPVEESSEQIVDLFGLIKKNAGKQQLPAGFYIIDGRKIIVK